MTVISGLYSTEKAGEVKGRLLRRTMIRYIILAYCIALRAVSFRLKKRFPSLEHLVYVGVLLVPSWKGLVLLVAHLLQS